ncbi:dTMP kinase [Galactobacter caseinivorans]|uniref:Thymidylate kinase n=1 Tax=Galactobacter caseinivorans TaxID=2676123 RepID=A0A496PH61_9MICC|nr:dTMP kinase [Galactobacter caseinivorans]RKW69822.1 dTMP kinase [Galactobacter caseinivorans]
MSSSPAFLPTAPTSGRGFFVTFEGGDGSGKSTQTSRLTSSLVSAGRRVVRTREPGGTPMAETLRGLVLDHGHGPVDARTEALLYSTARASHVAQVIRPALQRGDVVVCDRFVDSSLAYQGVGRGLGLEAVAELNRFASGGLVPDLTVLLDVSAEVGRSRRRNGPGQEDRLESEPDDFHESIRQAFLSLAAASPERYVVLDAGRPQEDLAQEILELVLRRSGGDA